MKRTLVLKKETLHELGAEELRTVAAGATQLCGYPTRYCASGEPRCLFSQYVDPCVTDVKTGTAP